MDSEIEADFSRVRDFAWDVCQANLNKQFQPCMFTFFPPNKAGIATDFVEIPWPLKEIDLRVLRDAFAATGVSRYALVVRDTLQIGAETKDMLLVWMCTRSFTWGRAWEITPEGISAGYREVVDAAILSSKAFRILDMPALTRKQKKDIQTFIRQNANAAELN